MYTYKFSRVYVYAHTRAMKLEEKLCPGSSTHDTRGPMDREKRRKLFSIVKRGKKKKKKKKEKCVHAHAILGDED